MNELNEPGLFRVHGYMEIRPGPSGYEVRRLAHKESNQSEATFVMPSLDGYEPINEQAEEMKLKELHSQGYRQAYEDSEPKVRQGELLASGRNTYEVLVKALTALSKRLGISITMEQTSRTYQRHRIMKTEYKSGPCSTCIYLVNDGGKKATLPLTHDDKETLLVALRALKKTGEHDSDLDGILSRIENA